jgi:hypothetical protein
MATVEIGGVTYRLRATEKALSETVEQTPPTESNTESNTERVFPLKVDALSLKMQSNKRTRNMICCLVSSMTRTTTSTC